MEEINEKKKTDFHRPAARVCVSSPTHVIAKLLSVARGPSRVRRLLEFSYHSTRNNIDGINMNIAQHNMNMRNQCGIVNVVNNHCY